MNDTPLALTHDLHEKISEFLDYLIGNGGPELQDYELFTSIVNNLIPDEVDYFREKIKSILNENTLSGMDLLNHMDIRVILP